MDMRPVACALALLSSMSLQAEPARPGAHASVDASAQGYSGNLGFNQAAGTTQQQVNSRAIAVGHGADATTRIYQVQDGVPGNTTGIDASARITGPSFSQGNGILGINQSAGIANQHSNAMRISVGAVPESLDDSVLAQSAAPTAVSGTFASMGGERVVDLDDSAFAGSRGVVQLNQSAGVGNRTANNLSIRVAE